MRFLCYNRKIMETNNNIVKEPARHPKIIVWSLIIAIIIVTNLFFNYVISLVYLEPAFNNFCPPEIYSKDYNNKNQCLANGGMWTENVIPVSTTQINKDTSKVSGYCNATYTCQKNYDSALKLF